MSAQILQSGRRGFTMTEVVISIFVLSILSITAVTSVTYTSRSTRLNSNRIAAKNIAQGYLEQMQIVPYAQVGPPSQGGIFANITPMPTPVPTPPAAQPVFLDEALGVQCGVAFRFTGYGKAEAGGLTSLTDNQASWTTNEWKGDQVYIIQGRGQAQYATIASNTANTLSFPALSFPLDSTSIYMINNGKTVEITTTWSYMGKDYTQTLPGLVVNYKDAKILGFEGI